jgi:hypothetical protein
MVFRFKATAWEDCIRIFDFATTSYEDNDMHILACAGAFFCCCFRASLRARHEASRLARPSQPSKGLCCLRTDMPLVRAQVDTLISPVATKVVMQRPALRP